MINKSIWIWYYHWKSRVYSYFLSVPQCPFSLLWVHQGQFSLHVSLGPLDCDFFVLMTLRVLRSAGQVFCRISRGWDFSAIFLMIHLGLWVFGEKTTETQCHSAAAAGKSLQSCPTLCDPIDGSPPGFPVPGILQARTLEWGAIATLTTSN